MRKQDELDARAKLAAVWAAQLLLLQTQIKSQTTKLKANSQMLATKWEIDQAE